MRKLREILNRTSFTHWDEHVKNITELCIEANENDTHELTVMLHAVFNEDECRYDSDSQHEYHKTENNNRTSGYHKLNVKYLDQLIEWCKEEDLECEYREFSGYHLLFRISWEPRSPVNESDDDSIN